MATNRKFAEGNQLSVVVTDPASPVSGDPVVFGDLPGVALTDEQPDGTTTVQFNGVFDLAVTADASGVAAGDIVNYATGAVGNAAGVRFGYALGEVAASSTATVPVKIGY